MRKYNVNDNYFEIIDTEGKAYFLGLLYADGFVWKYGFNLLLKDDKDNLLLLNKFKKEMGAENPIEKNSCIRKYENGNVREQHIIQIRIRSQQLKNDLIKLGCFEKKTFILKFPTQDQVPSHLIHHFMRGYFDGDGCVWANEQKDKRNDKFYFHLGFSLTSSDNFIIGYEKILNHTLKIPKGSIRPHPNSKNISILVYTNRAKLIKIREWLYKDAIIFLNRKKRNI